jgi:AcrR family transcriptional regulator
MTEDEAREQILLATIRLLSTKGYANMSMSDIVAESGVSKGGIYWHFKNKDAIIEAAFVSMLDAQLAFIEAQLAGTDPARDKLRRIFGIAHLVGDESTPPPLDFFTLAARDVALMEQVRRYVHAYQERIAQVIQQGIDSGELASVDPRMTALNLLSVLEGILLIGLMVQPETLAAQIDQTVELIFRGLLTNKE